MQQDYWVRVYKGNDIDNIQVKFNEDTGASKTSTKRSYQYRVVMIRQGVEQDMRARCSAGQRVSFYISAAKLSLLSETF